MKMESFKIEMFKSIINTGWININEVTAIIGKNESGKTTVLKALHRFNPFNSESYNMSKDWPKGRRNERNLNHQICSIRFRLSTDEKRTIETFYGKELTNDIIVISRTYNGNYVIKIDELEVGEDVSEFIDSGFDDIKKSYAQANLSPKFRIKLDEFIKISRENFIRYDAGFFVEKTMRSSLNAHAKTTQNVHQPNYEDTAYLANVVRAILELFNKAKEKLGKFFEINAFCIKTMPTYIYMDDHKIFKGSANLTDISNRRSTNSLSEEDKTILTILTLAGLDFDEEIQKINAVDKSERVEDFSDAGKTLTALIEDKWKQRKYNVHLTADGNQFFTYIIDETANLIPLEDRSKGFQWFFSFDLMFMHESKGGFQNCVILLDEPGLHLHPNAQRDLLERLYHYSKDNTLIYTTHLPFMIDLRRPENIKIITEKDKSTIVTDDLAAGESDTRFVLESALGMSASTSYIIASKNLIVEGVDDYWFLTKLSNILNHKSQQGLDDDILITASGGASKAAYIATIMVAQNVDVVLMLDSDKAGESAQKQIVDNWLSKYKNNSQVNIIMLSDALDRIDAESAIEDLFSRKFYLSIVKEVYDSVLKEKGIDVENFSEAHKNQITKILEGVFRNKGIEFKKDRISKRINKILEDKTQIDKIDEETLENARRLISALNAAFKN